MSKYRQYQSSPMVVMLLKRFFKDFLVDGGLYQYLLEYLLSQKPEILPQPFFDVYEVFMTGRPPSPVGKGGSRKFLSLLDSSRTEPSWLTYTHG
jgi:hypothetical protein